VAIAAPLRETAAAPADAADHATAYAVALGLLRRHRYDQAASAFHAIVLTEPGTAEAEDASFLEAVSLVRAGRTDAAALAAEQHLASFPQSFHRKEAAILMARAANERGDCSKADAILASANGHSVDAELRSALGPCRAAGSK
jgi:TolA-binding protein